MTARLIPILLLDRNRRLVKTVNFGERTYIGDPFNVLRLFNEKEVDEVCLLDIDAGIDGYKPDSGYLRELAAECFMPLAYGGGIETPRDCEALNRIGIEKFILGHAATTLSLVSDLARTFGSQAVCACIDARKEGETYRCYTRSGREAVGQSPVEFASRLQAAGVGELIIQSIDQDGARSGYDLDLVATVASAVSVPVIAAGGAGDIVHLKAALKAGAAAAASGSAFSFIGRLRAVLISYPAAEDLDNVAEVPA